MSKFKEYTMRSVEDFLAVPEHRRDECLRQFGMWLAVVAGLRDLFGGIKGVNAKADKFVWTDDGKDDMNVATHIIATEGR